MTVRFTAAFLGAAALLATGPWTQSARAQLARSSASASKAAPVAVQEPRDIVAALYRLAAIDAKRAKPTSPFYDRKEREEFFSKSFDLLITDAETRSAHDNKPLLDFDPISASQDAELQKVTLKTDVLEPSKATVSATFLNHKQPTVVTYDFIHDGGDWKINDIKGTTEKEAWSVRKILKATGKEPTTLPGMPNAKAAPDATAPLPPKKDPAAH